MVSLKRSLATACVSPPCKQAKVRAPGVAPVCCRVAGTSKCIRGVITPEEEEMLQFIRQGWANEDALAGAAKVTKLHPDLLAVVQACFACAL